MLTEQQFNDWVAALESDEFKQGGGFLYNAETNCHCILGVLGRVLGLTDEQMNKRWSLYSLTGISLTNTEFETVLAKNDNGVSWSEIIEYMKSNRHQFIKEN